LVYIYRMITESTYATYRQTNIQDSLHISTKTKHVRLQQSDKMPFFCLVLKLKAAAQILTSTIVIKLRRTFLLRKSQSHYIKCRISVDEAQVGA